MIDVENRLEQAGSELRLGVGGMDVPEAPSIRRRHFKQRAFASLGSVVLLVGALGVTASIMSRDGGTDQVVGSSDPTTETSAPAESAPTPAPRTAPVPVDITHLVESVQASSELSDGFGAGNLIDGDLGTSWQDAGLRGVGAEFTLSFSEPVAITEITINPVSDEARFTQNYWIQGYTITANDLATPVTGRLANFAESQAITVGTTETIELTFTVTTTYPSQPVGDRPPFDELAVAEIMVAGYPTADISADATTDISTTTITAPVLAELPEGVAGYDMDPAKYESMTRGTVFLGGGSSQGAPWAIIGRLSTDQGKPVLKCIGVRPLLNEDVCDTTDTGIWSVVYPVGDAGIVVFRPTQDAVSIVVTFDDGDAIEIPVVGADGGYPAIAVISVDRVGQAGSATSLDADREMIDTVRWEVTGFFEPKG
ncbi:MAG: discoidin domain-containing protein [Actinomycetota bacterium]